MLVSGGRVCLDLGYDVLECTMKRAGLVGLLLAACSSENDLLSQVDAAPGDAAPDEETTLPADTALPEEETDTGDAGDSIKNQPPGAPSVVIHPESPGANHDLECVISEAAVDPDGDALTYSYTWEGGELLVADAVLDRSHTAEGETWRCVVSASDGALSGPEASASVDIGEAVYSEDLTSGLTYDASDCEYCPDEDWYTPEKAFDDSTGTGTDGWYVVWSGGPEWISVDFGAGNDRIITRYGLMGAAFHEGYNARSWILQGSSDEKTWADLHTVENATLEYVMYGGEPFVYFELSNAVAYRHYRLWITENNGGQPYHDSVGIVEIEMFEDG